MTDSKEVVGMDDGPSGRLCTDAFGIISNGGFLLSGKSFHTTVLEFTGIHSETLADVLCLPPSGEEVYDEQKFSIQSIPRT
jgi:hypothetical protein